MIHKDWTSGPNQIPWPKIESDPSLAKQMLEILEAVKKLDSKVGILEKCILDEKQKKEFEAKLRTVASTTTGQ